MNGGTTGLEQPNTRSPVDAESERLSESWRRTKATLKDAEQILLILAEYKAAREIGDAVARYEAALTVDQRQRSREALHGLDPKEARQIDLVDATK